MIEPTTLARPYARAAFQFAVDNTAVDVWYEALQLLTAVVVEPSVACILDDPASTAYNVPKLYPLCWVTTRQWVWRNLSRSWLKTTDCL